MNYKLIKTYSTFEKEIVVVSEDGGIAVIREIDEIEDGDGRYATTDYYQEKLKTPYIIEEHSFEELAEGKMYYNDWTNDTWENSIDKLIADALDWLGIENPTLIED